MREVLIVYFNVKKSEAEVLEMLSNTFGHYLEFQRFKNRDFHLEDRHIGGSEALLMSRKLAKFIGIHMITIQKACCITLCMGKRNEVITRTPRLDSTSRNSQTQHLGWDQLSAVCYELLKSCDTIRGFCYPVQLMRLNPEFKRQSQYNEKHDKDISSITMFDLILCSKHI